MCGRERIRFVHIMRHPDYPDELRVGCVCAEKMSDDYVNPRRAEDTLKKRAVRRKNFNKMCIRDSIRAEYTQMLQNQLAKGNNGLIKTKYLTFGIDADNIRSAKPRLERIETDILNNFKRLGVSAEVLNGMARLAQLHGIFPVSYTHLDVYKRQLFLFSGGFAY